MRKISPKHSHQFSIADHDAVQVLLKKMKGANGRQFVDEAKIYQAIDRAASQYDHASQEVRQAFFHGLLTGYSVLLKTQKATGAVLKPQKATGVGGSNQLRSKAATPR